MKILGCGDDVCLCAGCMPDHQPSNKVADFCTALSWLVRYCLFRNIRFLSVSNVEENHWPLVGHRHLPTTKFKPKSQNCDIHVLVWLKSRKINLLGFQVSLVCCCLSVLKAVIFSQYLIRLNWCCKYLGCHAVYSI